MKSLRLEIFCSFCVLVLLTSARAENPKGDVKEAAKGEVEVIQDIAYDDSKDADSARNKLDLYLPKGQKGYPTIVYVHGGGWTRGDRKGAARLGQTFAQLGIGVAAVGYRLSPQVQHPAHVQDVAKAFAWVKANIAKHGGKPDQLYISGHSAGGHLAALLATDESYLRADKLSLSDIKGAIPISGVYQIRPGRLKAVFGDDAEGCKQASPLTHVKANLPPFLILYGEKESPAMGKMASDLAEALKTAKVEAASVEVKDRDHGSIVGKIPNDNDATTKAILSFITKHSALKLRAAK